MPLTTSDVEHVALLARIGLSDAEKAEYRAQLEAILEHVSQLAAIDTSSVDATAQITGLSNAWREDVVRPCLDAEQALANAPSRSGEHFVVGAIQE